MPEFRTYTDYEPGAAGGACYLCHAAPRDTGSGPETVVSTGINISFEGLLWVCATCIRQMGELVGMVDAGAAALAVQEAEAAREAAARAQETAEKATALADHLSSYNEYRAAQDRAAEAAAKEAEDRASREEAVSAPAPSTIPPAPEEGGGAPVGEAQDAPSPEPEAKPRRGRRS